MTTYDLYLESGPRRKTTYISVPALLGCTVRGATTEEAIDAAPGAVREYLRFLKRHGEAVDPDEPFEVEVAHHTTEGSFLGNGTNVIPTDHDPVSAEDAEKYARWLDFMHADLMALLKGVNLDDDPDRGRSLRGIAGHILGAEAAYLGAVFGAMRPLNALVKQSESGDADPRPLLDQARTLIVERWRAMTAEERAFTRPAGQSVWTAGKMFRRVLEHRYEHQCEIAERLHTHVTHS